MFEQMVKDMHVPPDVLAQLSDEQKDVLHYEIRQEQVRRYNEWQNTPENAPVTPKPRRKARFIYQKKKKEKHVTFCVDPDGKLAVQKFYVEKFPPINGTLAIIRPDGSTSRPHVSYEADFPQADGYSRHTYAHNSSNSSSESITLVPVQPGKQYMEAHQGAFHGAVQPTTFHREHWMDMHIGGSPHSDPPQLEPIRIAPIKDGMRSAIVDKSRLRHSDPTLNSQTSSISIQLNRGRQSMRLNDHPFTADVKPINTDAGGGSHASRRAMSVDLHSYDEPAWIYEPGRTEERIVHIRTPSISDLTSDPTQIQISHKHKTSKRRLSSSSTGSDSTDSDVININQSRGFRRLLISENGSVHEIAQDQSSNAEVPSYSDTESRLRLSFISDQRCNSENSLHTSPELNLRLNSQNAQHPTVESSPRGDSDSDPRVKFEAVPLVDDKVRGSPSVVIDSTRSQEILGGLGSGPNELHSIEQPASNLVSAENSPVLFRRSYANSRSNGFAALPSPTPRRRELMKVELKSSTLPAKVLSKNVSDEIRRRQEKLWKAVNQKEQKKSNLSWFHESEAPRLIREFHLPRHAPPDGLDENDFGDVPTWFHGPMNKMLAEQLLRADGRSGAFLTRVSSAFPGYVISYLLDDSVRHQFVSVVIPEETSLSDSQRSLTETASYQLYPQTNSGHFESLRDLVHFYMETSLASPEKQVLIHPVGQTKRKGELPDYVDLFYSKFNAND
ncbi:hypothetical protein CRM22_007921 [Opisthorchis felineus]|uniref:SH2 domain-containing protein n=1 Tax=Opisthorchis felineus TaxID=147828 RepID=A0A4S2LE49_OPIFE|nr:hypothetical protein CRM22_007921 [Opisthorchis felineus]